MPEKDRLIEIVEKYRPLGVTKGGLLLIPPQDAIRMIHDVAEAGFVILGLDGWGSYIKKDGAERIYESLEVDFAVSRDTLYGNNPVSESAAACEAYIRSIPDFLKSEAAYISLVIRYPREWLDEVFPVHPGP